MKYAINVPNFGDYGDPAVLVELARMAEDSGWDGFFVWDHMLGEREPVYPVADPWVALGAIASQTSRIRIGTMVTPVSRRRPWKLAREAVTLDHLSGGRVVLGVGLGYPPEADFEPFGEVADERTRGDMLDEALDVLDGLMSGEPFSYRGEHYNLRDVTFLPKPLQQPRIPVWVAGIWPARRPFRRAARWDGVAPLILNAEGFPTFLAPGDIGDILAYVRQHRAADARRFDVCVGGETEGDGGENDRQTVRAYKDAGVTWFSEGLSAWRGSLDRNRERLRRGPPSSG